jgi:hypothetical protein
VLAVAINPGIAVGGEKQTIKCVVEWEQVPAADVQTPSLTTTQLLAEFDKVAAAGAGLSSWDARCRVTVQVDRTQQPGSMLAIVNAPKHYAETYSTHLVSSGKQWFSERRSGEWKDEKIEHRMFCDNEHVQTVWPSQKRVILQTLGEYAAREAGSINRPELSAGFPPFLETQRDMYPIPESLPDVRKVLADPDTKVLPWRIRANGHVCYVVERTTITKGPLFDDRKSVESWQKWNPQAKPEKIDTEIIRLALDPQAGFMPVRWATGREGVIPGAVEYKHFPEEEIACSDFRKFGGQGYIAGRFEYTRHTTDRQSKQKTLARREVVLEEFEVNREYPPGFFHFDPPKGYRVLDSTLGIHYLVGDPPEKMAALLAAAQAKKAFYEGLKKKPVPPLEGALWLNTKPIRLEDARGKRIRLQFWSMTCGPCVYKLPQIQSEWETESKHSANPPVFVSIHPYVDGKELQQLKEFLKKQHITFPVMVDSREPNGKAWGKTFAYYAIYSVPSKVWIDDKGHFVRREPDGWMGESDWWMSNVGTSEPKNTTGGENESPVRKAKE